MKSRLPPCLCGFAECCAILVFISLLFLSSFAQPASASLAGEILYGRGSSEYLAGQYEQARSTLAQAAHLEPQHSDIRLALGLTYLALQSYREAYQNLRAALSLDPAVKGGQLYLGICLYQLERYQEAKEALLQAREQDPKDGLTRFYLALANMQLAHPRQSLLELRQAYSLSPEYAGYFKALEQILLTPSDTRIKKLRQEFMTGFSYDNNVELHTKPYYLSPGRKAPKHKDWAFLLGSRTEYYPVVRNKFNVGLRLDGFYHHHLYLESWNFFDFRAQVLLNWQVGPILISPMTSYDYTDYAGDRYSTIHMHGLTVNWPETDYLKGELVYKARNKRFHYARGEEYSQHGWDHQISFFQGLYLPPWAIVRGGLFYNRDNADGVFWASETYGATLDGVVFLPWDLTWWFNFEYGHTSLQNVDGYWEKRRRDNSNRLQMLLKKPITPTLALWFGGGYHNVRSNIPEWQFSRILVQGMITWNLF
jgi:tetratricopeptide (TPR) repeat protein